MAGHEILEQIQNLKSVIEKMKNVGLEFVVEHAALNLVRDQLHYYVNDSSLDSSKHALKHLKVWFARVVARFIDFVNPPERCSKEVSTLERIDWQLTTFMAEFGIRQFVSYI